MPLINRHIHHHCNLHHTPRSHSTQTDISSQDTVTLVSAGFAMLLRRCRIRYRDPSHQLSCPSPVPSISADVYPQNPPSIPCHMKKGVIIAENLEHQRSTLGLLVTTIQPISSCPNSQTPAEEKDIPKFEMLASFQRQLCLRLARCALQSQHDLLRSLGFLVEHRLRLTTITGLFAIVTTLSLREQRCLYYFVRCDLNSFAEWLYVPFPPCIA
jgi:hypothetical protein